ncbi:hypothetical protein H5410_014068 [Solanum commersonii]|uniref:AAA-type ATPase N-terminal domain-containing protein n=1 Tax=Solanum commersonii TaxID=4109 RepID=A0A9J5ZQA6_SOLCO|nr:hypothetical protein H5410_014068 [Solanum commersonii]
MEILNSAVAVITIASGLVLLVNKIHENRALFSELKKVLLNRVTLLYEAVEIYLSNNMSPKKCKIKVSTTETGKEKNPIKITFEHNAKVRDFYDGHKFKWIWLQSEVKSFNLIFREEDYNYVFDTYLPHIRKEAIYQKTHLELSQILHL